MELKKIEEEEEEAAGKKKKKKKEVALEKFGGEGC